MDIAAMVIEYMDSIFQQVYAIADSVVLREWAQQLIQDTADNTESQINQQLGT